MYSFYHGGSGTTRQLGGASDPWCMSSVCDRSCNDQGRGFGRDIHMAWAEFLSRDMFVAGVEMAELPRCVWSGLGVDGRQLGCDFVADCGHCCQGNGSRW